jgi:hypothetical protein
MMDETEFDIIRSLVDGAIVGNPDGSNMVYGDGQTPPTAGEITTEKNRLAAEKTKNAYIVNRQSEYPPITDQMDMIYKDMLNSTTTHKDAVEAVKTKWPKNNKGPIE